MSGARGSETSERMGDRRFHPYHEPDARRCCKGIWIETATEHTCRNLHRLRSDRLRDDAVRTGIVAGLLALGGHRRERDQHIGPQRFSRQLQRFALRRGFGCRRVSGQYTLRPASNGDPEPIYVGQGASSSGEACTGSMAEELAPELLANATFPLNLLPDGRLVMLQSPTWIALRPL